MMERRKNMIHKKTLLIGMLLLSSGFLGCLEDTKKINDDIDLRLAKLKEDDLLQDFQKINESENYIATPYTVEQGKLFEGRQVLKKYEVLFLKNTSAFLKQQIAQLSSTNRSIDFMEMLQSTSSIPGIVNDWNFTDISIEQIGDDAILKQNKTVINDNEVVIYLLVFRVDALIHILASGSISQGEIINYGKIVEQRINNL